VSARNTKVSLFPGQTLYVRPTVRGEGWNVVVVRPLGSTRTAFLARREGESDNLILKIPRGRPGIEDRIEREITAQFDHPNLIRLIGTATFEGRTILVLPRLSPNPLLLLNKTSIRARLSRDPGTKYYPIPPNTAVELMAELLGGLEHLHGHGFAHNDVKISNLLVDPGAVVSYGIRSLEACVTGRYRGVLIDLGAARSLAFLEDAKKGAIDTDFVPPQLTPAYAPPEVLTTSGRPAFGPAADIYAAGLTAYALYTGHYPYDHLDPPPTFAEFREVADLKNQERRGDVSPIDLKALEWAPYHDMEILARETSREAIEDSFRDLLRRMVAPDPERRPTAAKARAELEWIFQLDRRRRGFVGSCTMLRLKSENRFAEALEAERLLTAPRPQGEERASGHYGSSWDGVASGDVTTGSSMVDPPAERAWSRAAASEVPPETLIRYAIRAVEGLVDSERNEPPAPLPPPPAVLAQHEYDAILQVISSALASGIQAPAPPPPPPVNDGLGLGDLRAWGPGDLGVTPPGGIPLPNREPRSDEYARTAGYRMPQAPPLPAPPPPPLEPSPEAVEPREMRSAELFTARDVFLTAALSRSGLLAPDLIVSALAEHVQERRPIAAILRERYLNSEVVEALRVLARALASQPHEI
jgi:serine/threonine protein kinase